MKLISAITYTLFKSGKMVTTNKFINYKKVIEDNNDIEQTENDHVDNSISKKQHMSFSFRVNLSHMDQLCNDLLIFTNEQL